MLNKKFLSFLVVLGIFSGGVAEAGADGTWRSLGDYDIPAEQKNNYSPVYGKETGLDYMQSNITRITQDIKVDVWPSSPKDGQIGRAYRVVAPNQGTLDLIFDGQYDYEPKDQVRVAWQNDVDRPYKYKISMNYNLK